MVEQSVGLDVLADFGGKIQLKLGDDVENLVHLIRILVEGHQAVLNLHQIVALLENSGEHSGGNKVLVAVDLFSSLNEGLPDLGVIDDLRYLQVLLPLLDVLDDDLLGGVDGEGTGGSLRPGTGNTPGVHNVVLTRLGSGVVDREAVGNLHGKSFILVHETIGVAAMNGLQKVLSFG